MKNLLTLLLLVISLLAFGQSDSQSLEVEIKYWKSIAESYDTVAYREYLQRYGENGLYKDEANTKIALLKASGKQAQSINAECCFYSQYGPKSVHFVVRFESKQEKIWFKHIEYDTVRSNLAVSKDFYENHATIALSRGTSAYKQAIENDKRALSYAEYAQSLTNSRKKSERQKGEEMLKEAEQAKSPDEYKNAWTTDEEYQYDPMKSTSSRDVYFKRDKLHQIDHVQKYDYETKKWISYHDRTFYKYSDDEHNVEYYKNKEEKNNGWVVGRYEIIKTIQGYRYIAFSKDKSSFIMWFEEDDNLDGVILEKREYKRVPKEELLPKAVNYDFLNR